MEEETLCTASVVCILNEPQIHDEGFALRSCSLFRLMQECVSVHVYLLQTPVSQVSMERKWYFVMSYDLETN